MKKHLLAFAVTALAAGTAFAQAGDTMSREVKRNAVWRMRKDPGKMRHAQTWQCS